jgi:hypothetical protein
VVCLAPRAREDSMRPRRHADAPARPLNFTVRRPTSHMISSRLTWFAILVSGRLAFAQVPLDPASIESAAKLEPGQSIARGDSRLTLNQRGGGTKDEHGWYTATSKAGGFSVRFPAPVNDETFSAKAPDGSPIEQNILTSQTSTTRYMVTCTKVSQSLGSFDEAIKQIVDNIAFTSRGFKAEHFVLGVFDGTRYSAVDAQGVYIAGQVFIFGKQLCGFQAGSHTPLRGIPPEIHDWLSSFRPTAGNKD